MFNIAPAIANGAFVAKGESIAMIGDKSSTYPLCESIVQACINAGKTVHVLMSDTKMARTNFDSPEVTSDLLFVWQLPADSSDEVGMGTAWSAGKALSAVLFQRAEHGKSTLLASDERPRDWVLCHRLGRDTRWIAASIGIGLFLNPHDPSERPYFERVNVPKNTSNQELFYQHSVAMMSWVNDPTILSEFDRDSYRPDWHWVNCWQDSETA